MSGMSKPSREGEAPVEPECDASDLPRGWCNVRLGEVAEFIMGQAPPGKDCNTDGNGTIFVKAGEFSTEFPIVREWTTRPLKMAKAGDVLICVVGATAGKLNRAIDSAIGRSVAAIRPQSAIIDRVVYYQLMPKVQQLRGDATGSAQGVISKEDLSQIDFVLPPLAEQLRIVAKLEELLGKVSSSQQRLLRVPGLLKRFRQSILAAACSGKLTADWREENDTTIQPEDIVEAIRKRRFLVPKTAAAKAQLEEVFRFVEEHDSEALPESWRFVALNKLCESFDYGTSAKSQIEGTVPVLRMGNIQNGRIDWSDLVFTSDETEISHYSLKPKTVLFNRTNSPELVGKTAIYRGERPAIFAGYLIRINPFDELDAEYLNLCLNTNDAREFCNGVKTDGVSQSNINAQKLGTFEIPFPPLAEQQEIVRRVEKLFEFADQIEARLKQAQSHVDRLTQSILAKAFRGELVPTEHAIAEQEGREYEPASELLKRIRSQHDSRPATAKRRRKSAPS